MITQLFFCSFYYSSLLITFFIRFYSVCWRCADREEGWPYARYDHSSYFLTFHSWVLIGPKSFRTLCHVCTECTVQYSSVHGPGVGWTDKIRFVVHHFSDCSSLLLNFSCFYPFFLRFSELFQIYSATHPIAWPIPPSISLELSFTSGTDCDVTMDANALMMYLCAFLML